MSRRQTILETLLVFALFCLQGAWPVPDVNEAYYVGKAIHFWNPQWAASDWFLKTADTHTVFYFSAGWLSLLLRPTALTWTLRLSIWSLLAWSWQRLSTSIVPRAWLAPLTAAIFLFLQQHFNMAGEWVVGGAESKGFAFAAVFFALAAMAEGSWNRMWLLVGLATALHALVGGWTAVAAGAVWIAANPKARRHLSSWLAPLAAFLIALPGILPPLLMNRGADRDTVALAEQIYVFTRFPHHLDPTKMWGDGLVLPFLAMTVVCLLLWRTTADSPAARRLFGFTVAALALSAIGALFGLLSTAHRELAARMLRFYWFRLADVAVPLGLSLLAVRWFAERKMRAAMAMAMIVATFHVADCAVLRLFADLPFLERQVDGGAWRAACLWAAGQPERPLFPRQPRADRLCNFGDWLDVCRWAADPRNTPPDACFLVPRAAQTFRWYAARGEVGTWKDAPQAAADMVAWWERMQDIYATGNPPPDDCYSSLGSAGAARLRDVAKKYRADYLVTQVSTAAIERELHVVYRNKSFVVFKMR